MTHSQTPLVTHNLATVHSMKRLSMHMFRNFEKLTELNMAASKALMSGSFHHAQHLLDTRQPQQMVELQIGLMAPLSEKTTSYGQHVLALATDTHSELHKVFEGRMTEFHKNMASAVTSFTPNAPAGSGNQAVAIN